MTRRGYFLRLALCVAIDLFDFTLGRVPVLGTVLDGAATLVMLTLWGPAGLITAWELLDVTDQLDGFIPTATLIGLYIGWRRGFLGRRGPGAAQAAQD